MFKYFPEWFTEPYSKITDYDQEIIDPMEKIRVEIQVKNLFGTFVATIIGISLLHLFLSFNFYTHITFVVTQIICGLGIVCLYYKRYQYLGTIFCIATMIIDFSTTYFDERGLLCGLGFSIVIPGFVAFLTQSKRMAFVGLIYSIVLNMAAGPKFYEMILRESGNQNLADLLDSSRITLNVFTFYDFAFTALGESRLNKILNTLAVTLKAEEQMKQEKDLLASKSLFFSCFSHEMRNPLNCILGSMDYAIKYATDDAICDILSTGKACGSLLVNLINNILDMGKLDSNNIALNDDMRDSKQFITSVWKVTKELFKKKKQQGEFFVDRDFPGMIRIDDTRLSQVIVNLISNACKFTGEGKTIKVVFAFEKASQPLDSQKTFEFPQIIHQTQTHDHFSQKRILEKSTVQPPKATQLETFNTPRTLNSIRDEHIDQSHLEKLADVRSKKTLQHVHTRSQSQVRPPTQHRFMLLFATDEGTFKEITEWNPMANSSSPMLRSQKGTIKIEVIDSGCGMTEDEVSKLFKPFIQANKTITGTYGGTGLGLYITQSLTHLMKGTVTVKSEVNAGSKFTVSIPNDPNPSTEITTNSKLPKSQSPYARFKIILCSNNPDTNASWIHRNFQLWDFGEKMRSLHYRVEQVDTFMPPQTHLDAPSNFLKTYVVYDASYLTTENIQELKKSDWKSYENTVFLFSSNASEMQLQTVSSSANSIPLVSDSEVLTNEIHNHTKELISTIKSKTSILIVDDDDFNRKIFSVFLAREGYNIYTAENGQEGFEVYCQHTKDIAMVIVDYEMPICDGPTCAEKILKHVKDHNMTPVPIHALTGNVSQESKTRLAQAGIKKAWNKPAKLEEIMDEIFYVAVK